MPEPIVHPRALPNDLAPEDLRLRPRADGDVSLDPRRAGWRYLSFAARAARTGTLTIPAVVDTETCVVVQAGHDVTIRAAGERWFLPGREDVFDDLPSALWLPWSPSLDVKVGRMPSSGPATIAWARAPRSERDGVASQPIRITPDDVVVETQKMFYLKRLWR